MCAPRYPLRRLHPRSSYFGRLLRRARRTIRYRRPSNRPTQRQFLEGIIENPKYRRVVDCRRAYLIVLSTDWSAIKSTLADDSSALTVEKINAAADMYRNGPKPQKKRITKARMRLDKIRSAVRDRDFGTAIRLDAIWTKEDTKAEPVQ